MARAFDMNRIDEWDLSWDLDELLGPDPGPTEADRVRSRLAKRVTTPKKLEEAEKRETRRAEKDAEEDARRAEAKQRREARRLVDPDTGEIVEVEQMEILDVREVSRAVCPSPIVDQGGPRGPQDGSWSLVVWLWACVGVGLLAVYIGSVGLLAAAEVAALPGLVLAAGEMRQWIKREEQS